MGSGSTRPVPAASRSHATPPLRRTASLDPSREHDACGVGLRRRSLGRALARSRRAWRSRRWPGWPTGARRPPTTRATAPGLLTQIPHRLFYRDAYRLGLHLQPGLPFGVGAFFLPRRARGARPRRCAMIEEVLAEDGIPFLGWRDVPVNPAALGPDRAGVLPGDPPGAGGPARAGGRRGRVGARALPGATGDGATGGGAESPRLLRLLPLLPHHRLQGAAHRHPAPGVLSPTSATRSTRARSRSSTSATRPTRCRAGRWRSRSGCWRTTARSTRSGATGTR